LKLPLILLLVGLAAIGYCQDPSKHDNPGSLWVQSAVDPLRDRTASKEGDVITILISEVSSASYTAQTTTAKNDSAGILKGLGPILANIIPALGIGANSNTSGSGATSQTGAFTATMTAVVKKVFPNGTMYIEGFRDIVTNKDTQTIRISGIVRREDVRPDNTVLSSNIANAQIKASGKGQINDRQRRGLLVRLLDWLF
jgi:flagellar L-ring protein precursor FlgH